MSEYQFVERPLLTQLASMGWSVIDQGAGIPKDATKSLRSDCRQWMLTINAKINKIMRFQNG